MEESIGDRDWEGIGRVSIEESLEPFKLETIQKADHYARYLAKVNDTSEVHTTQDIRNHHGVQLVKSGTRLDQNTADKIIRHRLLQPLEHQMALKDQLDGDQLSYHFHALIRRFPDLAQIHSVPRWPRHAKISDVVCHRDYMRAASAV